jgi:hypothetical protein
MGFSLGIGLICVRVIAPNILKEKQGTNNIRNSIIVIPVEQEEPIAIRDKAFTFLVHHCGRHGEEGEDEEDEDLALCDQVPVQSRAVFNLAHVIDDKNCVT